jgi:hypothetical protein
MTHAISENPDPTRRWFHPTPGTLLVVLLAAEGILLLANWFQWIPKGWAVLIAIACVGVFLLLMGLWFALALVFRWRFQFSIRSLLVLTVAVAIPCSWLAVEIKRAREQREAWVVIQEGGGSINYDFQELTHDPFADEPPPEPEWLLKLMGDDFFHDVSFVFFFNGEFTNAILINFHRLPNLKSLTFMESDLSDDRLQTVSNIKQLKDLILIGTGVTDNGLRYLQTMQNLESLKISCTTLNDTVSSTAVSDKGLAYLTELRNLKSLTLTNTRVTAEGVRKLQQALPNCKIEYQ